MLRNHFNTLLNYVRQKIEPLAGSDGDLLRRFTHQQDEAAFNELLSRHAGYVWSICRRHLPNVQDAEDVFQATFIIFAQQAYQVRKASSIRSWLHSVAYRLVCKRRNPSSKIISTSDCEIPSNRVDLLDELSWKQVRSILDEELAQLPDKLRAPILLCHFDGHTQEETATILGWKKRTVKMRIQRGRSILQKRLTRRGIDLSAIFACSLATNSQAISTHVIDHLTRNAIAITRKQIPDTGITTTALQLSAEGSTSMSKSFYALPLACFLILSMGTGYLVSQTSPKEKSDPNTSKTEGQSKRVDLAGDPLPTGAIVRLGSNRFRHQNLCYLFFSPNGKELIDVSNSRSTIGIFDAETGKLTKEISTGDHWINSAILSPDSSMIATFGFEGDHVPPKSAIRLWKSDTLESIVTIPIENRSSRPVKLCFTKDGKKLIAGSEIEIFVFDVESGVILARQKAEGNLNCLSISPDAKTIFWAKYDLYIWNWEAGEVPRKLTSLGGFGTEKIYCTPDGKMVLSIDYGGLIHAFDPKSGKKVRSYSVDGSISDLKFSHDGKSLIIGHHQNTIHSDWKRAISVLDLETGKEIRGFRNAGASIALSQDGKRIAGVDWNCIRVWDYETGKPIGNPIEGHSNSILKAIFSTDHRIATCGDDCTIRLWDSTSGRQLLSLKLSSYARDISVSPDGTLLAMSGLNNDLRVWESKSGKERFRLLGNGELGGKRTIQFTSDGKKLIAFGDDWYLRVWDVKNGKLLTEYLLRPTGIKIPEETDPNGREFFVMGQSLITPDGKRLILTANDLVYVFDIRSGKEEATFRIPDVPQTEALDCSVDGKYLLLGGWGKPEQAKLPNGGIRNLPAKVHPITLIDLETHNPIRTIWSEGSIAWAIRFSPDGKQFASIVGDRGKEIHFFETETGKRIGKIPVGQEARQLFFDPDGKRLLVNLEDGTGLVYDLSLAMVKTDD